MRPSNACSRSRVMSARPLNRHCRFHDAILWPSHSEATSAHLGRRRRQRPAPNRGPVRRLRQHAPQFGKAGPNFDRGHEAEYRLPGVPRACGLRARRSERAGRSSCPKQVRRYRSPATSNLANLAPTPESSPPSAQPTRSPPVKISSAPPHPTPHLRNQLKA